MSVMVGGCKVLSLEESPNDKVGEVVRRVQSSVRFGSRNVYVTSGGGLLRRNEEQRS